jgi:hypothetical protein
MRVEGHEKIRRAAPMLAPSLCRLIGSDQPKDRTVVAGRIAL